MVRLQGQDATFRAVKLIHHDFGRGIDDGAEYLERWNNEYSGKPHTMKDLTRQLERISRHEFDEPRGHRCPPRADYPVLAERPAAPALDAYPRAATLTWPGSTRATR